MQKPKYIFSVVTLSLIGIIGGYLYLSQESTQFSLSSRTNESDLVNRLRTFSGADSKWGQSPFSSGTPVVSESKEDSSPNIPQPNTLWETKTRQINGKTVTYVFGEGNPKEVALSADEIAKLPDLARTQEVFYMTPAAELGMKKFLDSSDLMVLLKKCHKQLAWSDPYPGEGYTFPHDLSMETIMYIDPITGQKRFNANSISNISASLGYLSRENHWKQCITDQDRYSLAHSLENWEKVISNYVIYETPLNPNEPIIRVPGPDTDSPRPSWYNSGTPHDGDVTPFP